MTSTSDQPPKEYLAEREGPCHAFLRETFTSYDDHIQGGLLGLDKDSDEYQYICTHVSQGRSKCEICKARNHLSQEIETDVRILGLAKAQSDDQAHLAVTRRRNLFRERTRGLRKARAAEAKLIGVIVGMSKDELVVPDDAKMKKARLETLRQLYIFLQNNRKDVEAWEVMTSKSMLEQSNKDKQEVKTTPAQASTMAKKLEAIADQAKRDPEKPIEASAQPGQVVKKLNNARNQVQANSRKSTDPIGTTSNRK